MTLHGRSRQQRYTRQADWDYIQTCAQVAAPVPFFANGDVYSVEEYNLHRYDREGMIQIKNYWYDEMFLLVKEQYVQWKSFSFA